MSSESNKAVARQIFAEVFNTSRSDRIRELATPTLVVHYSEEGEPVRGLEAYERGLDASRQAFGEQYFVIDDLLGEGDRVALRWTMRAVHHGTYANIPATGREVTISGMSIYRFADGRVAEAWVNSDDHALLRQITAA